MRVKMELNPMQAQGTAIREFGGRDLRGVSDDMVDDGELPAEVVVPETTKRRRSTPPEIASTPLASAMAAHMESVILIEVTAVSPNFIQPWKMHGQRQSSGSGFIISDRRIITNHHVVKDAIDVRLRKHGVARRWRGKVVVSAHDVSARTCYPRHHCLVSDRCRHHLRCPCHQVDLAIVTVHEEEDDTFWDGVTPAEWGVDLPTLQSSVHVVGFPMGGSTICVTQGVVSRIDCKNYRVGYTAAHNPGRILVCDGPGLRRLPAPAALPRTCRGAVTPPSHRRHARLAGDPDRRGDQPWQLGRPCLCSRREGGGHRPPEPGPHPNHCP